jgi:hypothetical protein
MRNESATELHNRKMTEHAAREAAEQAPQVGEFWSDGSSSLRSRVQIAKRDDTEGLVCISYVDENDDLLWWLSPGYLMATYVNLGTIEDAHAAALIEYGFRVHAGDFSSDFDAERYAKEFDTMMRDEMDIEGVADDVVPLGDVLSRAVEALDRAVAMGALPRDDDAINLANRIARFARELEARQ